LEQIRNRDGLRENFETSGSNTRDEVEKAQQEASNLACSTEYLMCLFIHTADQTRFGGLKTALDNQFLLSDIGQYPKTLSGALKFLKNYKVPVRYQQLKALDDHV